MAITTHRSADPDALASVVLSCWILRQFKTSCCTIFPEGLNKLSKRILKELNLNIDRCGINVPSSLLVVDASNAVQLGNLDIKKFKKIYVIDHHAPGDLREKATKSYINSNAVTNTQLLVHAINSLGLELEDTSLATLGLSGIIFDSRRFQLVDIDMLEAVRLLILWGGSYRKALAITSLTQIREELSLRMARLKALQRVKLGRACKDILVAVTRIGSFESRVAKMLVDLGADVSTVIGYHGNELRISIRVSTEALGDNIDALTLSRYISNKTGGSGGGHQTAAMVHVRVQGKLTEERIEEIFDMLSKSLPGKVARLCTLYRKEMRKE